MNRRSIMISLASLLCFCTLGGAVDTRPQPLPPTDASGMEWVKDDLFLVVHDAKKSNELRRPRLSLLRLPDSDKGPSWTPLEVTWPGGKPGHDMESIARIPGTDLYLLPESGDDGESDPRIYLAELSGEDLTIRAALPWPVSVRNVEGAAVSDAGGRYTFIFAERAHGQDQTNLSWALFTLDPPAFGPVESVVLPAVDPTGPEARTVSALAVDCAGRLYSASTHDPQSDEGPFRSVVWEIGRIEANSEGIPEIALYPEPKRLATLDGLKVESLAIRETGDGALPELFIGTDDEYYGAVVRPLPNNARTIQGKTIP